MKKPRKAEGDRIKALRASTEATLGREFVSTVRQAKATGNIEAAHDKLGTVMHQAYVAAGQAEVAAMSKKLGLKLRFDSDHASVKPVRKATDKFLTNFKRTQERSRRQASRRTPKSLGAAVAVLKARPKFTSDTIRNLDWFGLTPNQERYVANYRVDLNTGSQRALDRILRDRRFDRTVDAAVNDDEPLNARQIDRMVSAYREKWINHRARTIARTQAATAVNGGRHAAMKQVAEQANFDHSTMIKTWNGEMDDRERDSHVALDGEEVEGLDEPFISDNGPLMYPGDPAGDPAEVIQCRCWLEYGLPGEGDDEE